MPPPSRTSILSQKVALYSAQRGPWHYLVERRWTHHCRRPCVAKQRRVASILQAQPIFFLPTPTQLLWILQGPSYGAAIVSAAQQPPCRFLARAKCIAASIPTMLYPSTETVRRLNIDYYCCARRDDQTILSRLTQANQALQSRAESLWTGPYGFATRCVAGPAVPSRCTVRLSFV